MTKKAEIIISRESTPPNVTYFFISFDFRARNVAAERTEKPMLIRIGNAAKGAFMLFQYTGNRNERIGKNQKRKSANFSLEYLFDQYKIRLKSTMIATDMLYPYHNNPKNTVKNPDAIAQPIRLGMEPDRRETEYAKKDNRSSMISRVSPSKYPATVLTITGGSTA